ncbi:MAG: antitoxin family protein [Planctomycetaceae bacterium]
MTTTATDDRSPGRRARDEELAAEPPLPPPDLPAGAVPSPMEEHLGRLRRPVAVAGIVENGVVRPLDPAVTLPEHARVIIVASERP